MTADAASILIVDDEPSNIDILVELLEENYELLVATTGARALELAKTRRPDLILLDVIMPEMDGYAICEKLKATPETAAIPVLFLTGLEDALSEAHGLRVGAVDYIRKPISPSVVKLRLNLHLELIRARHRLELQNLELQQAAKLREDVDRIMRHDLKAPLNAIIGIPTLMRSQPDTTEDQKEWLGMIESAGYNMLDMISRSLDLYKMEAGTYVLMTKQVDMVCLLVKIRSELRSLLETRKARLAVTLNGHGAEGDTCFISADEMLCYSMLSNLIRNAVEATPPGSTVSIAVTTEADGLSVRIHNHGAVPPGIRGRFFDKYVTQGKPKGTGLGTYSAKLIARTHGGDIVLDAADDETTLIVYLPAEPPEQPELAEVT